MRGKKIAIGVLILALMVLFGSPRQMRGQHNKDRYPAMAPFDQYLMDRDAEIALARSAAPEARSRVEMKA